MTALSGRNYHFVVLKIFEDEDTAQILYLDSDQVCFDPPNSQLHIDLSGGQRDQLNRFGWYQQFRKEE